MKDIAALHEAEFECKAEVVARAPGVVQLMGEHSQACDGLVLSGAASFSAWVAVSSRKDNALRFYACDFNERKRCTLGGLKYKKEDRWANYIKAALSVLPEGSLPQTGFSFSIASDIPQSQGFASSTALLTATLFALHQLLKIRTQPDEFWKSVMKAEEEFLSSPASFVEAVTARIAKHDSLLYIDLKSKEIRPVPFRKDSLALLITDSRVPRFSVDNELATRQSDCLKCISLLTTRKRVIKSLRDISPEELGESMGSLPELVRRRTLFVLEEMQRVAEAEELIRKKDFSAFGKIMTRSHDGLRDLYEVSCPEIDWLVKRALELEGTVFSRMTGKGFGGCTLTLIRKDSIEEYRRRLEEYERIFGFRPVIHEAGLGSGPSIVN